MAYITSHNCNKIVARNNFKDIKLEGKIYKEKIDFFSSYEENCLLAIQELMKNPEKYFKNVYNPMVAKDSKQYVYKENQPAYHTYIICERLNSNFTNFALPQEIIARGEEEIERFRDWFKANSHLLATPDVFDMRLHLAFKVTFNAKAINYENSGYVDFKNHTVQELEDKIDALLSDSGKYYYASDKNKTILKRFSKISSIAFSDKNLYNNDTGYSDDEVIAILKDYHNKFKLPTKKLLIEYYRIKLNPELQFAENLLDALGFKKCQTCQTNESIDIAERDSYEAVSYYSKKQHNQAMKEENDEAKSKFVQGFYNIENFKANPELLSQLSNIEKIKDESTSNLPSQVSDLDAIADANYEAKSSFIQGFYNIENFKSNPELLSQLSEIERITEESS